MDLPLNNHRTEAVIEVILDNTEYEHTFKVIVIGDSGIILKRRWKISSYSTSCKERVYRQVQGHSGLRILHFSSRI